MHDAARLKTITYTSLARLDLEERDLAAIHETARHFNALHGVTGLLVFNGARFLQVIEGSGEAVDNLVERLRRDRRHGGFEVRDERQIDARAFPDWSMELVRVSPGWGDAPRQVARIIPSDVPEAVRRRILDMAGTLAVAP